MHNNFYFLRQLSAELATRITGFTLVSCFSQSKDELVIELNNSKKSFFIKTDLQPEFQCLSFPDSFRRARKNSIDLFPGTVMSKVIGTKQFLNERTFALLLENENSIVFAMHGTRANVIWFQGDGVMEIFRNNLQADFNLKLSGLNRQIDWNYESFVQNQTSLQQAYFTFGKPVWNYLNENHFSELDLPARWELLKGTLSHLEDPQYNIMDSSGSVVLSLFPSDKTIRTHRDPIDAVTDFYHLRLSKESFQKGKASRLSDAKGKLKQTESSLAKSLQRMKELTGDTHYKLWADSIMANLHKINPGQGQIELEDPGDADKKVVIKVRKELSPQKNAAIFYSKEKDRIIELRVLKESIEQKEKEIRALRELNDDLASAEDGRGLKEVSKYAEKNTEKRETKQSQPFHEFEFKGFRIWVGKNAASNDTLTQKHSFKEDLWLHAKDVAGSHVLIKYQSGKSFPKDVIAYAAGLAAHFSKRKNETLCPVVVTPKKFVRKRKGDPPGAVVVEREQVIMVEPGLGRD